MYPSHRPKADRQPDKQQSDGKANIDQYRSGKARQPRGNGVPWCGHGHRLCIGRSACCLGVGSQWCGGRVRPLCLFAGFP